MVGCSLQINYRGKNIIYIETAIYPDANLLQHLPQCDKTPIMPSIHLFKKPMKYLLVDLKNDSGFDS